MLFLMNDVVLSFEAAELTPPMSRDRFAALSLNYVGELGKELFAEEPLLHRKDLERVQRLAALIIAKAPDVNAALFVAPARGCRVEDVQVRYAQLMSDASELVPVHIDPNRPAQNTLMGGLPEGTYTLQLPVQRPDTPVPVVELFLTDPV